MLPWTLAFGEKRKGKNRIFLFEKWEIYRGGVPFGRLSRNGLGRTRLLPFFYFPSKSWEKSIGEMIVGEKTGCGGRVAIKKILSRGWARKEMEKPDKCAVFENPEGNKMCSRGQKLGKENCTCNALARLFFFFFFGGGQGRGVGVFLCPILFSSFLHCVT